MFTEQLSDILETLKTNSAFSGGGFLRVKNDPNTGITNNNGNYFYIDSVGGDVDSAQWDKIDKKTYSVRQSFKLIIVISCLNKYNVIRKIATQLGRAIITESSTDSKSVFLEETGKKLAQDIDILRIKFELQTIVPIVRDCIELTCDDCC